MDLPTSIGRYTVIRALGQGGMGRVLLAKDNVLGRLVALKVLRDDLGIPPELKTQLFDRMRQEARAAATISHPNMVTLHDMGQESGVGLYLVFEYIEGPTLRERLADGPLRPPEVAQLARELGSALTHAHEAGVIHRDVKPENVMLAKSVHGGETAKLTDFGIARLPDSTLTRSGAVLGTPAYSAPESLATADFSALSDQFSLATTLYEALSGRRAFTGDDALTVATRVATEAAAPLPPLEGASSAVVEGVLARAMSKDKAKRYATCAAFGDALARAIELGPGPSRAETPMPRSSLVPRATRRWQNMIMGAAVVVIALLVVVGRRATGSGLSLRRVAAAFDSAVATSMPPASPAPPRGHSTPSGSPVTTHSTATHEAADAAIDATVVDASEGALRDAATHADPDAAPAHAEKLDAAAPPPASSTPPARSGDAG